MKLVWEFFLVFCGLLITCVYSQDFYTDESGKSYTIDPYGNRVYANDAKIRKIPKTEADPKILNFAVNLLKNIDSEPGHNFVVAPLSPQILLGCLAAQSRDKTKQEIVDAVGYENSTQLEKVASQLQKEPTMRELKLGNGFFVAHDLYKNLKESFFNKKDQERQVDVIRTKFSDTTAAKEKYKNWVRGKTKNLISKVDTDFDQSTKILLASTIYFKGQWLFAFNASEKGDFYLRPNQKIEVDVMRIRKKFHSGRFDNIKARWAAIPYNSTESMVIILPNEGENLEDVMNTISGNDIKDVIDAITGPPTLNYLNFTLPKFTLKSSVQLRDTLRKMKINQLFRPDSQLYLFNDNIPLHIGSAFQQSYLEVNEEGSVGASTTTFSAVALSVQPELHHADFFIDRPFLAFIIDRKHSVPYFMAKIFDPRL